MKTNSPPTCDIDSTHGAMVPEHIYTLNGEIDTRYGMYWHCPVEGCEGWGGPVNGKEKVKAQKDTQMELFSEGAGNG